MENPEYDEWYAPIDPAWIWAIGVVVLGVCWIIAYCVQFVFKNPNTLVQVAWFGGIALSIYTVGLVGFHVIEWLR